MVRQSRDKAVLCGGSCPPLHTLCRLYDSLKTGAVWLCSHLSSSQHLPVSQVLLSFTRHHENWVLKGDLSLDTDDPSPITDASQMTASPANVHDLHLTLRHLSR